MTLAKINDLRRGKCDGSNDVGSRALRFNAIDRQWLPSYGSDNLTVRNRTQWPFAGIVATAGGPVQGSGAGGKESFYNWAAERVARPSAKKRS